MRKSLCRVGVASALAVLLLLAGWSALSHDGPASRRTASSAAPGSSQGIADDHQDHGPELRGAVRVENAPPGTSQALPVAHLVIAVEAWPEGYNSEAWEVRVAPGRGPLDPSEQRVAPLQLSASDVQVLNGCKRLDVHGLVADFASPPRALDVRRSGSAQWTRAPRRGHSAGSLEYWPSDRARGLGRIEGQVVDSAGQAVAGATIGAYELVEGAPGTQPRHTVATDNDGVFRFDLPAHSPRDSQVLLAAVAPGYAPGSALVPSGGGELDPTITLWRESPLSLAVTLAGKPLGGASFELSHHTDRNGGAPVRHLLRLGGHALYWIGGTQVYPTKVSRLADPEGRLAFTGLARGTYTIQLRGAPGLLFLMDSRSSLAEQFDAPSGVNEWNIDAARLRVSVTEGGVHAAGVSVSLESDSGGVSGQADEEGVVEFFVSPGRELRVTVERDHVLARRLVRTPPDAGGGSSVVFDLNPPSEPARLEFRLISAAGTTVRHAIARLDRIGPPALGSGAQHESRSLSRNNGVFVMEVPPAPGRYRLVVLPGARSEHDIASYFLPTTREIALTPGLQTFDLRVRQGGRISVSQQGSDGRLIACHCRVFNASDDSEVPVLFLTPTETGTRVGPSPVPGGHPSVTLQPLPQGDYEVKIGTSKSGYKSMQVRVLPGATADIVSR